MRTRYLKAAWADLRAAARYYYEDQQPGLGNASRDEIRSTVQRIKTQPESWQVLAEDVRRCCTRRFPYGVFYRATRAEILIIAIQHLHQQPGRWRDRI